MSKNHSKTVMRSGPGSNIQKISANRETLQVVHNTVTPKAYPNKPHNYLKISSSFGVI